MPHVVSRTLQPLTALFALLVVVFSFSFAAAGCGGDDDPLTRDPVAPEAGTPATPETGTPPDAGPAGVLSVRISGLPTGTAAAVVVTGTDFEKSVPADADLPLPAGTYVVRAAAVGDGTVPNADAFRPNSVAQTVTLEAKSGAIARVAYTKVVTKLSPDTKVVDADTAAAITNVALADDGSAVLSLGAATAQSMSWKPNDILVLGQTLATPGGFFGRVVSSNGTTIVTKRATMQEVVEEGVFLFSRAFGSEDVTSVLALDSGVSAATKICNSLSASLPAKKGIATLALTAKGDLCFTADMKLSLSFSGKLVPDVYFRADAGITAGLTVEGAATIGIGVEVPIFSIGLGNYTIWTGPVPWVITPELTIVVGANGQVTAGVRAGFTASASAYGGFTYDSKSNAFSPFSGKSTSFGVIWPEPFATATVKGYGGPELALLIDKVAGPFVSLHGYTQFDVDFLAQPLWKLHAGVELAGGFETAKLLGFEYSIPFFTFDKVIAQSTDTPPLEATVGSHVGSPSDQGIAVGPDDTFYMASGNTVNAFKINGPVVWTYTGGPQIMIRVIRGADGTIYANDFDGVVYALNANGTQKWKLTPAPYAHAISLSGTTLYAATTHSLIALSAATGAQLWEKEIGEEIISMAIAKDGFIFVNTVSAVMKLDPSASGNVVWGTPIGQVTGGIAIAADGTVFASYFDGPVMVAALNPNGTLKWSKPALSSDTVSTMSVGPDGSVYMCGSFPDASAVSLDAATGNKRWSVPLNGNCGAAPTLSNDGKVYIIASGSLRAVSATTGALLWKRAFGGSTSRGSPNFLSKGNLVAGASSGILVVQAGGALATTGWPRGGFDASNAYNAK